MALKGNQAKLDMNNSGSIDAEDFKILRSRRDSAANYKNYGVGSPRKNSKYPGQSRKSQNIPCFLCEKGGNPGKIKWFCVTGWYSNTYV